MFKAVITEEETIMIGNEKERLEDLLCYIDELQEAGTSEKTIREIIDFKFKKEKDRNEDRIKTLIDNDNIRVRKINLAGLSEKEKLNILDKILNMED